MFLLQYMAGKEETKKTNDPSKCRCRKAEIVGSSTAHEDDDEEELRLLDNGDAIQAVSADDDFRFPSPVKNVPILETSDKDVSNVGRDGSRSRSTAASAGSGGRKTSDSTQNPQVKSATGLKV